MGIALLLAALNLAPMAVPRNGAKCYDSPLALGTGHIPSDKVAEHAVKDISAVLDRSGFPKAWIYTNRGGDVFIEIASRISTSPKAMNRSSPFLRGPGYGANFTPIKSSPGATSKIVAQLLAQGDVLVGCFTNPLE